MEKSVPPMPAAAVRMTYEQRCLRCTRLFERCLGCRHLRSHALEVSCASETLDSFLLLLHLLDLLDLPDPVLELS